MNKYFGEIFSSFFVATNLNERKMEYEKHIEEGKQVFLNDACDIEFNDKYAYCTCSRNGF